MAGRSTARAARAEVAVLAAVLVVAAVPLGAVGPAAATLDVGAFHNEGDACLQLRLRRQGTCVRLADCPNVYAEMSNLVFPQICGFSGGSLVPNVCCVSRPPRPAAQSPVGPAQYPAPTPPPSFVQYPIPDSQPIAYPTNPPPSPTPPWYLTTKLTETLSQDNDVPEQEVLQGTRKQSTTPRPPPTSTTTTTTPRPTTTTTTTTTTRPRPATATRKPTTTTRKPTTTATTTTTTPRPTTTTTRRPTTTTTTTTTTTPRPTATTRPTTTSRPKTTTTRRPPLTTTRKPEDETQLLEEEPIDFPLPDRGLPFMSTTSTTSRPTTTSTTTQRATTSTTRRTTTSTTKAPRTSTSTARPPPAAVMKGQCFTEDSGAETAAGRGGATAVISLRQQPAGSPTDGDVDVLPEGPGSSPISPEPAFGTCSPDEGCPEWATNSWKRERRVAADGYPLAVDEQVRLRLSTVRSGQLFVGICGDDATPGCAVIAFLGTEDPAAPGSPSTARFETRATSGNDVADPRARVLTAAPARGSATLPSGRKYTLVVHRRSAGRLDAWLDNQPDRKTSVPVGDGMAFLRASSSAGVITFVQGQEVDGYHMEVGERVVLRLNVTRDGLLDIGLCGDRACSVVRVTGVEPQGAQGRAAMGFSTRITASNSVTEERGQTLQQAAGPGSFPVDQSFTFEVLRRTEWGMDVWLAGDPERKATVPLEPDRLRLKVDSDAGSTAFERGEAADGLALQPGKSVVLAVAPDNADGVLDVSLCGRASCASVRVLGADGSAGLGFSTRTSSTNSASDEGDAVRAQPSGPTGFRAKTPLRLVARHAVRRGGVPPQLQVWLQDGDRAKRAAVDLNADQANAPRLKVASTAGAVTLQQELRDGHELAVGETVTVALTVTREDGWLFLGLCGAESCSAVGVIGASDDSRFSFTSRITTSNSVVGEGSVWQSSTRGPRRFVAGQTLRFSLQRRTQELMDVWLEPAQSKKATIPLEDDRTVFKVASDAGMLVFDGDSAADAVLEPGYRLAVAEEVRVELRPARAQGWLFVGLCGRGSCSVLGVGGAADGKLSTATRTSAANSVLAPGPIIEESAGPDSFVPDSVLTLVVRRVSEHLMTVRTEAGDVSVSVPLQRDHDRLDVVSSVGSTSLLPGSAVDGHPMAVDERVRLLFQATRADGWLALGLCGGGPGGPGGCSTVRLTALRPLSYQARTTRGTSVGDARGDLVGESAGAAATPGFVAGRNYTLVVHRQSEAAADVWLDGDPGLKVSLPLQPGMDVFKADSNAGSTYLEARGARDGWPMAAGDKLWVSLSTDQADGRLYLGLCGDGACSVVRVTGVADGRMGFSTAIIPINSVSGRGDDRTPQTGALGFTPGEQYVFVVRRGAADGEVNGVLEVWLEDDADNMAVVPLGAGSDRLKVTSTAGTTTFVTGRDWVTADGSSSLVSPRLRPPSAGAKLCVDVEYMATSPSQALSLSAVADRAAGSASTDIARLLPDRVGSWSRRTVLASLPPALYDADWRLSVAAAPGLRVRRLQRCSLDKNDAVVVAAAAARRRRGAPTGRRRPQRQAACANGGLLNATDAASPTCTCPPGFAGDSCQAGCAAGAFGRRCELRCPGGCANAVLCVGGLYCGCAPGLRGDRCDQECRDGDADCRFPCDVRRRRRRGEAGGPGPHRHN